MDRIAAGDAAWQPLARELQARLDALAARGEGLDAHARERALLALWLQDRPQAAWQAARANLALQKEPLDWWLALARPRAGMISGAARSDRICA